MPEKRKNYIVIFLDNSRLDIIADGYNIRSYVLEFFITDENGERKNDKQKEKLLVISIASIKYLGRITDDGVQWDFMESTDFY